jgi:GT2 family glycosyltransferase
MLDSVANQTYKNWELCISDGSNKPEVRESLKERLSADRRIKVDFLDKNYGIAGNTNKAIQLATGDFIAFLDHDDVLAADALYSVVEAINSNPGADLFYSDEDKLSYNGKLRAKPHFKPDWSPDTLRSYNYITHLSVLSADLLKKTGLINNGFEGSQDYDFIFRATEKAKNIVHIPKILYHWREHKNSTASNTKSKDNVSFSTEKAVSSHLDRVGLNARVYCGPIFGTTRIVYSLPEKKPLVSIIIPTKDCVGFLKRCVESIVNRSTYTNYEILIVDTGSKEKETLSYYDSLSDDRRISFVKWDKPFNYAAVNNFAAKKAKGQHYLFLNNDTEVMTGEWIESMLEFSQRSDVGAVGAKLFYPDTTLQHGGVIIGLGGVAGHSHKYFPSGHRGYFGRLVVPTNLSAVTAACIMIPKTVFEQARGFDEGYALAFNDVDLCLKIRGLGKLIVWTPYAQLVHYESKTRGYEDTAEKQARFAGEVDRFKSKWGDFLRNGDPYYSVNLTLDQENFGLRKN